MATLIDTAVHTSNKLPNGSAPQANGTADAQGDRKATKSASRSKYKHVFAVHSKLQPSCLTRGVEPVPNFVGFRNLMVLMLFVSNLRLMIENFKKYGVLICLQCHDFRRQDIVYGLVLYLLVPFHLFAAYVIELAAAQQAKSALGRMKKFQDHQDAAKEQRSQLHSFRSTWRMIALAHGVNATLNLIIATTVVYYYIHHPGIGTICELHAVIVWLKVCSYAFTNRDLRHALLSPSSSSSIPEIYNSCPYPSNITIGNLTYFWWAPTLIYQPVYPRTSSIRWPFVFKRLAETAGLIVVIWFASAQYAAPLLQNSLDNVSKLQWVSILERVMKLSTISLFCWLAGFYALFHSFLNALAEIMRFGDREFYGDWWNAPSLRLYWTLWNKPVYQFMRRHVHAPLVGRGVPPKISQVLVFVFSGFLHELLVGVPTHNILGIAFIGMFIQVPLIAITDTLNRWLGRNGQVAGNVIFWISFCLLGQPFAALMYFFAWQAKYGSAQMPRSGFLHF
ncbi:hypothetical protein LTS18_001079 [Coniosporium uncinatum]|uniref:Uncharacterized protein n=1 Tax=Coniosporium uncinatum TaxID=93489 RepID=A0ACC3DCT1_9PEZI|nr:hypothetical protein LTS18_001079 [Coniosporium uncinatum]